MTQSPARTQTAAAHSPARPPTERRPAAAVSADGPGTEARFAAVFSHLGLLVAYARRRGAADPDAIAAEAMTIAWRRLADVPRDDPRPWLIATARNLLLAERRRRATATQRPSQPPLRATSVPEALMARQGDPRHDGLTASWLDPELERALRRLSDKDREALLLIAWEDLTPAAAAASLGISPAAFRVRLHRARRRLIALLGADSRPPATAARRPRLEDS